MNITFAIELHEDQKKKVISTFSTLCEEFAQKRFEDVIITYLLHCDFTARYIDDKIREDIIMDDAFIKEAERIINLTKEFLFSEGRVNNLEPYRITARERIIDYYGPGVYRLFAYNKSRYEGCVYFPLFIKGGAREFIIPEPMAGGKDIKLMLTKTNHND